jgi:DUF971 family protein
MDHFEPITIDPEHIAISKSKGVKIDWRDRHHSEYDLRYLRDHCPCAQCKGAHGTPPAKTQQNPSNPLQLFKPTLKIDEVEPIGNYALRLRWNDGHSTGIYSFEHLRRICPCPACLERQSTPDIL